MPKKKDFFDIGNMDFGFSNKKSSGNDNFSLDFNINEPKRKGKQDFSMMMGIGDLVEDFSKTVRDTKKEYTRTKKSAKLIKEDLTPSARVIKGQAKRGIQALRERFRGNRPTYYVGFIQGGTASQRTFKNKKQAQAFREKYLASGVADSVTQVVER